MANGHTINTRGLIRTSGGWIVAEVRAARDDSGVGPYEVKRQKLIAGPFTGLGAKRAALDANGGRNDELGIYKGCLVNAPELDGIEGIEPEAISA